MSQKLSFYFVTAFFLLTNLFLPFLGMSQVSVSYNPPAYYVNGQAITNLSPTQNNVTINGGTYADVTTFAGTGTSGGTNSSIATSATFSEPTGMVKDALGNYYIAEMSGKRIRKISSSGSVSTVYQFSSFTPRDIAINTSNGDLYVIISDHRLLKLPNTNSANYPAQAPVHTYTSDAINVIAGQSSSGSNNGTGTAAKFNNPWGLAISPDNSFLLISDFGNNKIRKVVLSTLVVSDYISTTFSGPTDVCFVDINLIYVAEFNADKIRKIVNQTTVSDFVGGTFQGGRFDGTGAQGYIDNPHQITADSFGNLYVVDNYNHKIRKVTPAGVVSTVAGSLWDNANFGSADGNGIQARFKYPRGILYDTDGGFLLVGDTDNHSIRKVQLEGFEVIPAPSEGLSFNTATGVLSGTPTKPTLASQYIQTFNSASLGTVNSSAVTLSGDAAVHGDLLYLTPRQGSKSGGITIPATGVNSNLLQVEFDLITTHLGGADGLSYSFAPDANATATSPSAEIGTGTKLSLSFATYSSSEEGIRIMYNPTGITTTSTTVNSTLLYFLGTNFFIGSKMKVKLSVDADAKLYLWINGSMVVDALQLPSDYLNSDKSDWKHVIRARTGGSFDIQAIDNLSILQGYGTTTHKVIARDNTLYQEASLAVNIPDLPTITTTSITGITSGGATVNYAVNYLGSGTISGSGIVWGSSTMPTLSSNLGAVVSGSTSTGNLSSSITGLDDVTTYYARSYVTTTLGHTEYGNQLSFTTLLAVPEISYNQTNSFVTGSAIAPLTMANTGGAVSIAGSIVSTIAGNGSHGYADGTASLARFNGIFHIVIDSQGNKYVSEENRIRKITPNGIVSTFVGSTQGDVNGIGTAAKFYLIRNMAIDANDNIFVSDVGNKKIKKITPAGVVTTFASSTTPPLGMAFDAAGNLFVAYGQENLIRKYTPQGVASVFVGSINQGTNNGTGTAAQFYYPKDIVMDANGDFYVLEPYRIRKVTAQGVVTTLAGSTTYGSANGTGTSAGFGNTIDLTISPDGDLYLSEAGKIRKITPTGVVTTFTSTNSSYLDGAIGVALFNSVGGLNFDASGNLIVVDNGNARIRQITPPGIGSITVSPALPYGLTLNVNGSISGTPLAGSTATNYTVTATNAAGSDSYTLSIEVLTTPSIVTNILSNAAPTSVTAGGNVLSSDGSTLSARGVCWSTSPLPTTAHNTVLATSVSLGAFSVTVDGLSANQTYYLRAYATNSVGTSYGDQVIYKPTSLTPPNISYNTTNTFTAQSSVNIPVSNTGGAVIASQAQHSVIATGTVTGYGTVGSSQFHSAGGVETDLNGDIIFSDYHNHQIKKVTPAGVVTTVAGTGYQGYQDGLAANAEFTWPRDVVVDNSGNIFVLEHFRIRKITPDGNVSTITTGISQEASAFDVDANGNFYVCVHWYNIIQKVSPDGSVSIFAGDMNAPAGNQDGIGQAASFNDPRDISIDPSGNLFITDEDNHTIRKITPEGVVSTFAGSSGTTWANWNNANGIGTAATFYDPQHLKVDDFGNIFVTEGINLGFRKITPNAVVTNVSSGLVLTNSMSYNSWNYEPRSLTIDNSGIIYYGNYNMQVNKSILAPIATWTITPALPAGLTLGANGDITGTAYMTMPPTNYTITATNDNGSDSYTLSIEVTGANDQIAVTATTSNIKETTADVDATLNTVVGNAVVLANDPYHMVYFGSASNIGTIYQMTLTGQTTSGIVWGTENNYSYDSRLSKAAVHAGILDAGETGTVYVMLLPGLSAYGASNNVNGVTTYSTGSKPYTYSFVSAPSSPTSPVLAKGFVYATSAAPELGGAGVQSIAVSAGTTSYNTTLTGLTPGQTYYVRAYATNATGTFYSTAQTITTADISYADVNVTYGASNVVIQNPSGTGTSTITYSSSNTSVCTNSGATMIFGNAGTAIITATQAPYGSYGTIVNTFTVTVAKADQVLNINLYQTGTSLPQSAALSTLTGANSMEILVSSKYMQGTTLASTSLVPALSQTLVGLSAVLTNMVNPYYYTFGNVANAVANGTVTFTLSHPGNDNFNPATVSHTMDISNDLNVITFGTLALQTYAPNLTFSLANAATTSTGAAVSFAVVSGPAILSGTTLSITGAGTVVITASSTNAVPVTQSLIVNKATPVFTFNNISKTYGDAPFMPTYSTTSNGNISYLASSQTSVATEDPTGLEIVGAGTSTITLSLEETPDYLPATATATLTVAKAAQTINFQSVSHFSDYFYYNPIVLPTTSSAGLSLSYSTAAFAGSQYGNGGPAGILSANTLFFDEAAFIAGGYTGSIMLTMSQSGDANYLPLEMAYTINVYRAAPVITATPISTASVAQIGSSILFSATTTASFPGHTYPITIASSDSSVVVFNTTTGMLDIVGPGTAWVIASHQGDAYFTDAYNSQQIVVSGMAAPTVNGTTQYACVGETLQDLNVQTNIVQATLKWYDAATGGNELPVTEVLANGTYWVSQITGNQESSRSAVTVVLTDIVNTTLSTISGSSTATPGTPLVLSVTQINGATSYIWDLPAGLTIASSSNNGATVTITVSSGYATGIVKVKALNSCGETAWQTKTVNAPGQAGISITTTQSGAPVICGGATSVPFSATAATGATYAWTLPTGLSFAAGYDGDEQTTYVNFAAGYVGGAITCVRTTSTATNTASYSVGGVATPGSISGLAVLCDITTTTYSIGSVPNATSYEWQLPTGMSGTSTTNSITATWTGIVSGTVKVRAIGTCGTSAWRTLSVGAVATPSAISGPTMICGAATYTITGSTMTQVSQTTLNYSVTNVAGLTYNWSVPAGMSLSSGQGTNAIVVEVDPTTFTTGQVTVTATATSTSNNTCVSSARTLTVSKAVASITGPTAICGLTTATYSVPSGSGTSFTWTLPSWMTPATGYTLTSNPIQVDIAATGTSTQSISVEIETSCGDVTVSRSVGCGLYTQLSSASCGAAVSSLSAGISANNIVGAQGYKFQIAIPSQSATTYYYIESSDRWFALSEAMSMPQLYGTTYSIRVSLVLGNSWGDYGAACTVSTPSLPTTTLSNSSCGATLSSLSAGISANNVQGATMYRFEITPDGSQTTYTVDSPDRWFALTEATGMPLLYGTTYSITVTLENGTGVWGTAGAACTVTTPTLPTTMLSNASCGATLSSLSAGISANNVQGTTTYRFTITPNIQNATSYTVDSPDRWFALTEATGMSLLYGTTYSVTVTLENGTGIWGTAGTACTVTTPTLPTTTLSIASCGATLTSFSTVISANNVQGATMYEFHITDGATLLEYTVQSPDRWITLSEGQSVGQTPQALVPTWDNVYTIKVKVQSGSVWSAYGTECFVNTASQGLAQQDPQLHEEQTEGLGIEESSNVNGLEENQLQNTTWTATATSNPFAHSFQIKLNGAEAISTDASFTAQLTDMSGKVYSQATLSKEQLEAESFGEQLAPGMYLMTLRQGEELRVIRVVKR
jgi:sugar lactone lactonase YvrE